jgi:preprotein translocase subunit SecD
MNVQSRLGKVFFSQLMLWVAVIVVGSYYMISFDRKVLNQPSEPGILGTFKKYANAARLTYIKKGIDLAGGTYLVLSVDIDKAIENKLMNEARSVESLLKSKEGARHPVKREIEKGAIELIFADEAAARATMRHIQDSKNLNITAKLQDNGVRLTLSSLMEQSIRSGAVEQGVNVLNNRLGGYGVEGIIVQQHGDHQIVIQMPGLEDAEHIKDVITKTAHLEFKIVEKTAASRESLLDDYAGELPSDKMIVPGKREGDGHASRYYLVSTYADLTGDHISAATVDHDEFNRPMVSFKLDSTGGREFAELTGSNVGKNLGIIIDDVMMTAPNIKQEIAGGSGVITGIETAKEAFELSIVLKSGSLQAPLKIENENRVGASLGQDSINKGMFSCLIALALIFIFSLLFYKIPGLLAVITLICNIFLILLLLSPFGATLTLPGIAGIVLTIGMAIDASILIYERVKEELREGIPFRQAIMNGFEGAMPVIMDSNITTFLTGAVLFWFGGPAIKGFAVTLMMGIVATVLSGVYFLKAMYLFLFDVCGVKQFKI